jgi:hypothetical protein
MPGAAMFTIEKSSSTLTNTPFAKRQKKKTTPPFPCSNDEGMHRTAFNGCHEIDHNLFAAHGFTIHGSFSSVTIRP